MVIPAPVRATLPEHLLIASPHGFRLDVPGNYLYLDLLQRGRTCVVLRLAFSATGLTRAIGTPSRTSTNSQPGHTRPSRCRWAGHWLHASA